LAIKLSPGLRIVAEALAKVKARRRIKAIAGR
jgi:hypothetical protein